MDGRRDSGGSWLSRASEGRGAARGPEDTTGGNYPCERCPASCPCWPCKDLLVHCLFCTLSHHSLATGAAAHLACAALMCLSAAASRNGRAKTPARRWTCCFILLSPIQRSSTSRTLGTSSSSISTNPPQINSRGNGSLAVPPLAGPSRELKPTCFIRTEVDEQARMVFSAHSP
ncbi:hypothetical protein F5884DRAFT_388720 [Xylogone sp. PMI_703]|nr:hypothetical protein F5884DRAFT_388720 [Xylogone sp. PMI_703]